MDIAILFIAAILWVGFLYWLIVLRPGRLSFWRLAGKNPDKAYDFFMSEDCWRVFIGELPLDYRNEIPEDQWHGPFLLGVPKLNEFVNIFGRIGEYEASQERFMKIMTSKSS